MKLKYLIFVQSMFLFLFTVSCLAQNIDTVNINNKENRKTENVKTEKVKTEKLKTVKAEKQKQNKPGKPKKVKVIPQVLKLNKIQEKFNYDSLLAAQTASTVRYESQSEADLKFMKVENQAKAKKAILDAKIDKTRKAINIKAFEKTNTIQSKASAKIERIQSKADRKKEKAISKGEKALIQIKAVEEVENLKYTDYLKVKKQEFQLEADIKIRAVEEEAAETIAKSRTKLNKAKLSALGK